MFSYRNWQLAVPPRLLKTCHRYRDSCSSIPEGALSRIQTGIVVLGRCRLVRAGRRGASLCQVLIAAMLLLPVFTVTVMAKSELRMPAMAF